MKKGMTTLPFVESEFLAPRATLSRQGPVFYLGGDRSRPASPAQSQPGAGAPFLCLRPASLLLGPPRASHIPMPGAGALDQGDPGKRAHSHLSGKAQGLLTVVSSLSFPRQGWVSSSWLPPSVTQMNSEGLPENPSYRRPTASLPEPSLLGDGTEVSTCLGPRKSTTLSENNHPEVLTCEVSHQRLGPPPVTVGCRGADGLQNSGAFSHSPQWSAILESSAWEEPSKLGFLPLSPCFPEAACGPKAWLTAHS